MSESDEQVINNTEEVAETQKVGEEERKYVESVAAEEQQSNEECGVQQSEPSAAADNEGSTAEKSVEQPPVEGESPDTEGGGAEEKGTAATEKAEKFNDDNNEADKTADGGEGEAEKVDTLESGEGVSNEAKETDKPSDGGEMGDTQSGLADGNETVEAGSETIGDGVDNKKVDGEAKGEKTDGEDKVDEEEATSTSEQQVSSAEPPIVSVKEGEDKKTEELDKAATEEKQEEEEEEEMVFDYDYEQLKSTPEMVNVTTSDMLTLFHSFGYECEKRSNLVVLSTDMVVYAAGNLVVLLNLDTQQQTCIRSLGGGGIGALAVQPSQAYFAVGEKGTKPVIAIYTYPELKLHRILRDGTEEMYSHMDFSPGDGKLLASVGGSPDYMLTVWDWEREKTVLRSKAFSQDIYRVTFSPENANQLTTSGTGHIRFWKMATTFTGLKLQGQLGKFGRIEISDISAYVELPDGKVLSGTEWGNLLLWDGGFIKVEISRKGKKYCHNGMIEAIYLDEGELISAGADGYVRVWDFETIDNADITDENITFEMDPLAEIKVGHDVSLKTLSRSVDVDTPTLWYAQDAGGAIWKIDIVVSHTRKAPEKLMSFHSGEITGLYCSPVSYQAASISQNGSVRVYDLPSKQLLCHSQYTSGGSSLIWAPVTIDPSATTIFAGFTDGVVRVLRLEEKATKQSARHRRQQKYQLTLLNAVKPHTKPVTSLAMDGEGKVLASGSKDNTVFFLNVQDQYSPIGFINTPAPVTTMRWSSGSQGTLYLLVCCEDGSMMEVSPPDVGQYDTSKTYHLDELKYTSRKFTSIKDRLRAEEEEARQAAERERKRREKEAKKQQRREELGEDYVSEEEEEEEEEEGEGEGEGEGEAPPTEAEEKPKGPSSILSTFFNHEDESKFWVSMSGYDAGYLYECSLEGAEEESEEVYESPHTIPVPPINGDDLPLHSMTFSSSGEYFLTGTSNGSIRIHQLDEAHSLTNLTSHWSLTMHDNHYGAVTHLVTSFDDKYVLSGGADGNLFIFEGNFPTAAERAQAALEAKIPSESGVSAKDIEDPDHYSVEDAKQKAEHDRMMKLAEEKKQHVRRQIASLRRTFAKLQQKAAKLPGHLQLDKKEFVMDPDMERQMKAQAEEKIELVRQQMAWETEKHNIALRKLQKKYKGIVECERITVYSFSGEKQVSSFRTTHPSAAFLKLIEELNTADTVATPLTATVNQKRRISVRKKSVHGGVVFMEGGEGERGISGEEDEEEGEGLIQDKRKSKQEARRLKKEMRKKEWEDLYTSKPDEKQGDPEEARLLEQARENLGDYKLKTASDYVVPEHQRVTTKKKRQQLMMLRAQIFDTKKEYNKKLIALRDWKLQIVEKISELVKRLEDLQTKLPASLHKPIPPVPVIRPDEVPERQYQYTKETLLKFKEEKKAKDEAERLAATGAGDGFFGGFGGGGGEGEGGGGNGDQEDKKEEGGEEQDGAQSQDVQDAQETSEAEVASDDGKEAVDSGRPSSPTPQAAQAKREEEKLTKIEAIMKKEQLIYHEYEQGCLLAEIHQLKCDFDEALFRLRHAKVQLDIDMVAADLKHITQFEELQLLKEFEKKETIFTSRYKNRKQEKQDLESKMEEVHWAVSTRESTLSKLIEQEKALEQSFLETIGENNKFKDFLLKVFRKKIKRAKRKQEEESKEGGAEGGEDEDSEEESDSDYLSSSEDESGAEGELDDSICPAGCDHTLFDQACEMREKRLDMEDAIAEEKKALESQKKELEGLKKKAKTMDVHVKNALSELQAFQLKKQQRLNELDQVAILRLHQILHHGKDGEAPKSIAPCLVFPATALHHLGKRIGELTVEKQQEKKRYKELRHHHVKLNREKKEMQSKIAVLNEKANEAMMLKFGRIVDLDRLEGLSVNHIVEGLHGKLRKVEQRRERDVSVIETEINSEKRNLAAVTRENTERLNRLHELHNAKERLEERLNARQKTMSKDVAGGESHLDEEEKQRLVQIVRIQASEIDALRQEIQVLLCKGGHILPPSQPPTGPMHPTSPGTLPPIH